MLFAEMAKLVPAGDGDRFTRGGGAEAPVLIGLASAQPTPATAH